MGLPEELFACALTGKPGPIGDTRFLNSLAGAILVELALAKRIEIGDAGEVAVVDTAPTGDPPLDRVLAELPAILESLDRMGRDRTIGHVTPSLVRHAYEETYDRGVTAGWVQVRDSKLLGLVSREVLVATPKAEEARERARRILLGEERADERGAALATLIAAAGLVERLVPKGRRADAEARAEELAAQGAMPGQIAAAVRRIQQTVRGIAPG